MKEEHLDDTIDMSFISVSTEIKIVYTANMSSMKLSSWLRNALEKAAVTCAEISEFARSSIAHSHHRPFSWCTEWNLFLSLVYTVYL